MTHSEPSTYSRATNDLKLKRAMKEELDALEENRTWIIMDRPRGKKTIGCKWVHKVKLRQKGVWNAIRPG